MKVMGRICETGPERCVGTVRHDMVQTARAKGSRCRVESDEETCEEGYGGHRIEMVVKEANTSSAWQMGVAQRGR